ncbi:hypothetical protein DVH24_029527 [Malus domestica]|uniref:Uncharacterized protein n=1 Tax=Malus domestica TaxID=3750 RepID=A0A498HTN9_MALDO|nr:hypothetical protein DVH24_029527 [Malus domestica]
MMKMHYCPYLKRQLALLAIWTNFFLLKPTCSCIFCELGYVVGLIYITHWYTISLRRIVRSYHKLTTQIHIRMKKKKATQVNK